MSRAFEEIDHRTTAIGEISLRRRLEPVLQVDVWEVKLDDEFLMSSLFTASEEAVGRLGMAATPGEDLRVVVGGLGLGYTARAALEDERIRSLYVIERLEEVIGWHRDGLVPLGEELTADPRCRFVNGDFFAMSRAGFAFDDGTPGPFDAVLVDIDHTPSHHLDGAHATFYSTDGMDRMAAHLVPGGVFALWSDDPPDGDFVEMMSGVFSSVTSEIISFPNHYTGAESSCTVYLARR